MAAPPVLNLVRQAIGGDQMVLLDRDGSAAVWMFKVRIMSNTINHFSLGKFGAFLFARQPGFPQAPRHKSLFGALAAWRNRRRATTELSGLSDRNLADIGVTRQEIPEVVRRGRG